MERRSQAARRLDGAPWAVGVPMTPDEFAEKMRAIDEKYADDKEVRHGEADDLMYAVLLDLGFAEGLSVYAEMDKWYA